MADNAPSLSPFGMVAAIASLVLGVVGIVGTVLQIITTLVGGGLGAVGAILGGIENVPYSTLWSFAAIVIGLLIYVVGFLLSLGAAGAGVFGLVKKTVTPIIGLAVVIVVFDLLCHMLWPVVVLIVSFVMISMDGSSEAATINAVAGLPGIILAEIWSLVLVVLWSGVAVLGIMERRKASQTLT